MLERNLTPRFTEPVSVDETRPGTAAGSNSVQAVQTACGGAARTPASGGLLPGFVSMGLGAWTNPNLFPGQQVLRWNIGGYDVQDACTGATQHFPFTMGTGCR